jgi:hypothetical protein
MNTNAENERPDYVDFKPATNVARLPYPDDTSVKNWFFVSLVKDLHLNIPPDPNPRAQVTTSRIAKAIRKSLTDPDETFFHLRNRGVLIVAKDVEVLSNGSIRVNLTQDPEIRVKYGMADGATTYRVAMEILSEGGEDTVVAGEKLIMVEVMANLCEGDESLVPRRITSIIRSRGNYVAVG